MLHCVLAFIWIPTQVRGPVEVFTFFVRGLFFAISAGLDRISLCCSSNDDFQAADPFYWVCMTHLRVY